MMSFDKILIDIKVIGILVFDLIHSRTFRSKAEQLLSLIDNEFVIRYHWY